MARADLEAALTALTAYSEDRAEPKTYREWANQSAEQAERILFPTPTVNYMPVRGDDVDKWLRAWRDRYEQGSPERKAINLMVDEYQYRAQNGMSLIEPLPDGVPNRT